MALISIVSIKAPLTKMTKKLQKSLQDYLAKIKNSNPSLQFPSNSISSKKKWILSGCKHPKTPSFAIDPNQNVANCHEDGSNKEVAATLADVDRFLFENFKSLYIDEENVHHREDGRENGKENDQVWNCPNQFSSFESPRFADPPPEVWRSHRFFVDPGSSSSLIEEARSSLTNTSEDMGSCSMSTNTLNDTTSCNNNDMKNVSVTNTLNEFSSSSDTKDVILPSDCIAVLEYSPDPRHDFRRSMDEMVEARLQQCGRVDWDYMEELLFCYMNLNDKKSHKFILSAFVDLIVGLRQNSDNVPARSRGSRIARESNRKLRRNVT